MYLSIVEEYFFVEATHNLHIGSMNKHSTQKSCFVDFIQFFKYCFFSLIFKHGTG